MPALRRPPLPRSAQRIVWLARAASTVGLAFGLYLAARLAAHGAAAPAMLVLSIAGAYAISTWLNPLSPWMWIALAVLTGLFVASDHGPISITLAVALVVLFWLRSRPQVPSVSSLTPIFTDEVMPRAATFVAELTDRGWEHVGGYAFQTGRTPVTAAVLLHPEGDRYAAITDMVYAIESRFDDARVLLTINSGRASLPPFYLTNVVKASPADLAASHQQALELLAERGLTPLPLDPEAVVEEALASEVETLEWSARHGNGGLFNFGGGAGELDGSAISATRIETWLEAPALAE
jgi:hypothetical protein